MTASGRDQNNQPMSGVSSPSYSIDNSAVATVNTSGLVTAGDPGTAQLTVSLSARGVTRSAVATIIVQVASSSVTVTAPGLTFVPANVDILRLDESGVGGGFSRGRGGDVGWCWDSNVRGQLGNAGLANSAVPERVAGPFN